MKKVALVTPEDAAYGFALAGVPQQTCVLPGSVPPLLADLTRDETVGLVVLDERLVDRHVRECMRELDRRWPGLVVALPAPQRGGPTGEDYVLQLIRRAIGYQVRLD